MAEYNYYKDELVQVWQRMKFTIEADSKEEADAIAKEYVENTPDYYDFETLGDTEMKMDVADNRGMATAEVFDDDDDLIANNVNKD